MQAFFLSIFEKTQLKKNSILRKNPKLSLRKIQKLNISQVFWLNLLNRAVKKLNQKLKELNFWIHLNLPLVKKRTQKKLGLTVTGHDAFTWNCSHCKVEHSQRQATARQMEFEGTSSVSK